jgi:hypothetical protein
MNPGGRGFDCIGQDRVEDHAKRIMKSLPIGAIRSILIAICTNRWKINVQDGSERQIGIRTDGRQIRKEMHVIAT